MSDEERLAEALDQFVYDAQEAMYDRMVDGARRWGVSWRDGSYTDVQVLARLRRAVDHLDVALQHSDDPSEWKKRAADVANQAFMASDPRRRSRPAGGRP